MLQVIARIAAHVWIWGVTMNKKIIECETCGAFALEKYKPLNNICPVCCSIGSLFINTNPSKEQLAEAEVLDEA